MRPTCKNRARIRAVNQRRRMIVFSVVMMSLLLPGCATPPASRATAVASVTLTAQPPTSSPTPLPTGSASAGPEVHTTWGTYVVTLVHHATSIPPDCDPKAADSCTVIASAGHHILIV